MRWDGTGRDRFHELCGDGARAVLGDAPSDGARFSTLGVAVGGFFAAGIMEAISGSTSLPMIAAEIGVVCVGAGSFIGGLSCEPNFMNFGKMFDPPAAPR